jgi:hypothetical protein
MRSLARSHVCQIGPLLHACSAGSSGAGNRPMLHRNNAMLHRNKPVLHRDTASRWAGCNPPARALDS